MLKPGCSLAKIGADTAENERHFAENLADELDARDDEHDGRAPGVEEAARRREVRELLEGRAVPGGRRAEPGEQEDLFSFRNFCNFFANVWRARSRLHQNEILQENMRLTAFFKLYKICILSHRCNLNFFSKKSV